MKLTLTLLLTIAYSVLCNAQTAFIGGHIANKSIKSVTIQYYSSALNAIENKNTVQEVLIDSNREFKFYIETEIPLQFHLLQDENWVFWNKYIAPDDSIWIDDQGDKMDITGRGEQTFAFLFQYEDKIFTKKKIKEMQSNLKTLEPLAFAQFWSDLRKEQHAFLQSFLDTVKVPDEFINYVKGEIDYSYAVAILQYSWRSPKGKPALFMPSYNAYLKDINFNNPKAIVLSRYVQLMRELPYSYYSCTVNYYDTSAANQKKLSSAIEKRDSIAKVYFTGEPYDLALFQILHDRMRSVEGMKGRPGFEKYYAETDSIYKKYEKAFNNPMYYEHLYSKLEDNLAERRPAKDFVLKDLKGNEVKLSDFKGKVVYLDFWATNCGPCVAEIPDANKLKAQFKNQDVVFLYVSMDRSVDHLTNFIFNRGFDGNHLQAPKGFASQVALDYGISAIPHYFLIDKKGNIANNNAPRPSHDPSQLIWDLLKE